MREEMAKAALDVVVCRLAENVLVLSGYYCVVGYAAVVFPREGDPILIAPRGEEEAVDRGWVSDVRWFSIWDVSRPGTPPEQIGAILREVAEERRFPATRVGYEGSFEYIAPPVLAAEPVVPGLPAREALEAAFPGSELVDATPVINQVRAIKTERDRNMLRRTNEVAAFGYAAWKEAHLEARTDAEAAAAFGAAVTARGIGYEGSFFAMAWPQVASGELTGDWSYYLPTTQRRVRQGEFAFCEAAVCVDGYWTDLTRTFVVGEPSARQRELFDVTRRSLEVALQSIGPGARGVEVDRLAREALGEYGKHLAHHVGHGIGWKYHEPVPMLNPVSRDVLRPGMCMVVEPAAYVKGFGGVRNEEMVIVTDAGSEVLSDGIPISID
jgi:Xaa-Pro aminopeptidase